MLSAELLTSLLSHLQYPLHFLSFHYHDCLIHWNFDCSKKLTGVFPEVTPTASNSCYLTAFRSFWEECMTERPSDKKANSCIWHNYTLPGGKETVSFRGFSQTDTIHLFCKVHSQSSNSWLTEAEEERLNVKLLKWKQRQLCSSLAGGVKSSIKSDRSGGRQKEACVN